MKLVIRSAVCSLMVLITQFLFVSYGYAAAPDVTSYDVIAVCTGSDSTTASCVDVSSSPYYLSIPNVIGAKLFIVTQQMGYGSQSATFKGSPVSSVRYIYIYDPYPIVSGFVDYWDCGTFQTGSFSASTRSVNNSQVWTATTYINVLPTLSVSTIGTGSGTVTPDSGSLSWSGNVGTANFPTNTQVILTPTESAGSTFDGWSGACTNTSGTCTVTMNANKSVSATFTVIPNARIGSVPYGTLNKAYSDVSTDGVIEAKAITFTENLILNRDVPFTLRGGYSDDFSTRSDFTILDGTLTIMSGRLNADGLVIRDMSASQAIVTQIVVPGTVTKHKHEKDKEHNEHHDDERERD